MEILENNNPYQCESSSTVDWKMLLLAGKAQLNLSCSFFYLLFLRSVRLKASVRSALNLHQIPLQAMRKHTLAAPTAKAIIPNKKSLYIYCEGHSQCTVSCAVLQCPLPQQGQHTPAATGQHWGRRWPWIDFFQTDLQTIPNHPELNSQASI